MARQTLIDLLIAMRPKQWVKNLLLFAALVFSKAFLNPIDVWLTVLGFGVFCMGASAVYLLNDIVDKEEDRHHPTKRHRPIASSRISVRTTLSAAGILLFTALAISFCLMPAFAGLLFAYILLNISYSLKLKHLPIVDVICIALGFVIRAVAGAVLIGVTFSSWLIASTFFLTLTLGIYKRSNEHLRVQDPSRKVLAHYNQEFLRQIGTIAVALTLMTYALFTLSPEHSPLMMLTVPFVVYGLFRYLLAMDHKQHSDDGPVDDLFNDRPLQVTILLWIVVAMVILVVYG